MALIRGKCEPIVLPDAVHFAMTDAQGRPVTCLVTFNALAIKARKSTWLTAEEARDLFYAHRDEIEAAASAQFQAGVHIITIGAAELSP